MRKIIKNILTAINNPKINEELKKEKNIKIVLKDIQYKEAVLEILEKENKIDMLIINEQIIGEIDFLELLKKIRQINSKIEIIVVLKKENKEKEKELNKFKVIFMYEKNLEKNNLIKIIFNTENKKNVEKNITENIIKNEMIENNKKNINNKSKFFNLKNKIKKKKNNRNLKI